MCLERAKSLGSILGHQWRLLKEHFEKVRLVTRATVPAWGLNRVEQIQRAPHKPSLPGAFSMPLHLMNVIQIFKEYLFERVPNQPCKAEGGDGAGGV